MTRTEAAERLEVIAYEIYDKLGEMEDILWQVAPGELEMARAHWMVYISLKDTLIALEEEEI